MGALPPTYHFFQSAFVKRAVQNTQADDSSAIALKSPTAPAVENERAFPIDPELLEVHPTRPHIPKPRQVQLHEYDRSISNMSHSFIMKVTIHGTPTSQRTWFIQESLLTRHSIFFRTECEHASAISPDLTGGCLATFQNFVDFVHSSIYSTNKCSPDYHIVLTHLQAWVLGYKLEAPTYQTAALRELYTWIEPLARGVIRSAAYSPIRVQDIEFVCGNTEEGCVLRALIFDAVAAHWTQHDALSIGDDLVRKFERAQKAPKSNLYTVEITTWTDLYNTYPGFRKRISSSWNVHDSHRTHLLRPIDDYIAGKTSMAEEGFVAEIDLESILGMRPRALRYKDKKTESGGHMRSPSRRRRSSSASSDGLQRGTSKERQIGQEDFMMVEDA